MKLKGDLVLPDDYAALIGRIVEAWAHFEFEVDVGIWRLMGTPDELAACVTSQLNSMHPRFYAFIALAQVSGANKRTVGKLKAFFGERVAGLGERRNRSAHDPRMVKKSDRQVSRLSISARNAKVTFEYVPEPLESLAKTYNDIFQTVTDFLVLRNLVLNQIAAKREASPLRFRGISQSYG